MKTILNVDSPRLKIVYGKGYKKMKRYEKEYPLISIHIPKAGGTSFTSVLRTWFGKRLYLHYFDPKHGTMPRKRNIKPGFFKRRFQKGVCIHGHFNKMRGFGVQDYYPEVNQFITVLRNPLELALSNYYYLKWHGNFLHKKGHPGIDRKIIHR